MVIKPIIVLVDDDQDDIDIFSEALAMAANEIELITERDSTRALEMLAAEAFPYPAIILIDLNMPRINGREMLVAIRKIPRLARVPLTQQKFITSTTAQYKTVGISILGTSIVGSSGGKFGSSDLHDINTQCCNNRLPQRQLA